MSLGSYSFVTIKGQQGKHEYYLIQCPLRLVPRLFLFDEAEVPLSLRRARSLDPVRAADIAKYVTEEPETYVLAPLVATINEKVTFEPIHDGQGIIGRINIPITAQLILQDGQHRRLAIQQFLSKSAALGDNTIPVMLFPDENLERSQRLYAVLNNGQMKKSRSKQVLHEHSDLAALVQQLIDDVPLFQGRVEREKTTISNRSTALFTISAVYQATAALLHIGKRDDITIEQVEIAQDFWQRLGETIPEWREVIHQQVSSAYLRQNYVHSHTVTLIAIGMAGHDLIQAHPDTWQSQLERLGQVNWSKNNAELWEGRAMIRGKMSKTHDSIKLTAITIKRLLGIELAEKEQAFERAQTGS